MKKFLILTLTLSSLFASAQGKLRLKSGTYTVPLTFSAIDLNQANSGVLIWDKKITNQDLQRSIALGIGMLNYLPDNSYEVIIPKNVSVQLLKSTGAKGFIPLIGNMKLDKPLAQQDFPSWAWDGDSLEIRVLIYDGDFNNTIFENRAHLSEKENWYNLKLSPIEIKDLVALHNVRFVQAKEEKGIPENNNSRSASRTSLVQATSNYDGTGIAVGHGDDGDIGPHVDYQGRLTSFASASSGDHGDHVAGTIMGAGNIDPDGRGIAPGADLIYRSYPSNLNSVDSDYSNYGVRVTNSSYSNGCNAGYTSYSAQVDQDAIQNPGLIHVFSAGNSNGSDCGYGAGSQWGNVTGGHKQGKNVVATANITYLDAIAGSSSRGPAADGRIKPDLASVGTSVYSTIDPNSYGYKTGTSMAAPGAAGFFAVLHQAYNVNRGQVANGGLLKAIAMNTADDLGNPGPDFTFGYGRINMKRAVRTIESDRFLDGTISTNGSNVYPINLPVGAKNLRIMLYWTDPQASTAASQALVNDLDLEVSNNQGTTLLPWVLDATPNATTLNNNATRGVDRLNNVEQVTIQSPGTSYSVTVKGFNVPSGSQKFYVTYEYDMENLSIEYPHVNVQLTPGNTTIRWNSHVGNSIQWSYSNDSMATWTNISVSNATNSGIGTWNVPSISSGKVFLRGVSGTATALAGPFTVLSQPSGLSIDWLCPDSMRVSVNAISGADSYTAYLLGAKYMDSITSSNSNSMVIPFQLSSQSWVSMAGNVDGTKGKRAYAVQVPQNTFGCPLATDIQLSQISSPGIVTSCHGTVVPVTVEVSNPSTNTQSNIPVAYSFLGQVYRDTIVGSISVNNSVSFTFSDSINWTTQQSQNIIAWTEMPGDMNSYNDTVEVDVDYINSAVQAVPFSQNFDTFSSCSTASDCGSTVCALGGGWTNLSISSSDDIDWRVNSGSTPSSSTGPSGDISGSGKYIYLETSGSCSDKSAVLLSPCISLTNASAPQLTFNYHMYGSSINSLTVEIFNGQSWQSVFSKSGNQGNAWNLETINLSNYIGDVIILRFTGTTGSSYTGDIALDEIYVGDAVSCPAPTQFNSTLSSYNDVGLAWSGASLNSGEYYTVEYGLNGFSLGSGSTINTTSTAQNINNLSSNTSYDFYVKRVCSANDASLVVGPLTIATAAQPTEVCGNLTLRLKETYGDGWNGNTLTVRYGTGTNATSTDYTISASSVYTLDFPITSLPGDTIAFIYNGIGTYLNETSYEVLDDNGTVIYASANGSIMISGGVDYSIYCSSTTTTCVAPSNLNVTLAGSNSAIVSWSGTTLLAGQSYLLEYGTSGFAIGTGNNSTVYSNSTTINGLNASTTYDFYLTKICSTGVSSSTVGPVSITTGCGAIVAPYSEGFENWQGTISPCWSGLKTSSSGFGWTYDNAGTPSVGTGPNTGNTGDYYIYLETSGAAPTPAQAYANLPLIDLSSVPNAIIEFAYHMYGSNMGDLTVEVSNNGINWTVLNTISGQQQFTQVEPYIVASVDLTGYASASTYIRFGGSYGGSFEGDMAIDDIYIVAPSSCPSPVNPNFTAGINDVDGHWKGVINTGESFLVEYDEAGFNLGTGNTMIVLDTTVKVLGLKPATGYQFYVSKICASGDTSRTRGPYNVSTTCPPFLSAPYTESFEGWGGDISPCWSGLKTSTTGFGWTYMRDGTPSINTGPVSGNTGDYFIYLETSGSTPNPTEAYANLPPMDLSGISNPIVSFYYHMHGNTMGTLTLEISDDGGANWDSLFTVSGQQQSLQTDSFNLMNVNLSGLKNISQVYLRFGGTYGGSYTGDMAIDDIYIGQDLSNPPPSCIAATGLVINPMHTMADLSWTGDSTASYYVVEYGATGFTLGTGDTMHVYGSTMATVTGLDMNTSYEYYVTSHCSATNAAAPHGPVQSSTLALPTGVSYDAKGCQECDSLNVGDFFVIDGDSIEVVDKTRLLAIVAAQGDLTKVCVSHITDMKNALRGYASHNYDIGHWDVSNVTNMNSMFFKNRKFNQDISAWDVSSVTNMLGMFSRCDSFNQNLNTWDVSSVTNLNRMFKEAVSFNGAIAQWNVENVTRMTEMFSSATAFNQDLSDWCVRAFQYQPPVNFALNSALVADHYPRWGNCPQDFDNVTSLATGAFINSSGCVDCSALNIGDYFELGGDTLLVVDRAMLDSLVLLHDDLSKVCVSNITDMKDALRGLRWFNTDIAYWDVSNVTDMSNLFFKAQIFNQDIGNWDVSNVTKMVSMFQVAKVFDQDIGSWDVSGVQRFRAMFRNALAFNQDIGGWDVSSVLNDVQMSSMFRGCASFNQDISMWCVTNAVTKPSGFDANSALIAANLPLWGTCPTPGSMIGNDHPIASDEANGDDAANPVEMQEIALFPNPTTGIVQIDPVPEGSYKILDAMGKTLEQGTVKEYYNFSEQPNGVYTLMLQTRNGIQYLKVIRQ